MLTTVYWSNIKHYHISWFDKISFVFGQRVNINALDYLNSVYNTTTQHPKPTKHNTAQHEHDMPYCKFILIQCHIMNQLYKWVWYLVLNFSAHENKSYSTQYLSSKHIQTGFEKSKVSIQLLDQANKVQNILEILRMTAGAAYLLFCVEVAALPTRGLHGLKTEARTRPVPEIVWPNPTRPERHS